jgi:alkylhydroperoxidase family enzyme
MSDVAAPLDDLRVALSEVDVLAVLTGTTFDDMDWTIPDPANVEVMATLLGLIDKSSFAAMGAYHRLRRAVDDAQPVPAGERWDYDKGTSPGGEQALSAEDAAIVRRIRTRCPDKRFDGGSDAELLDLFRRNKRVLNRNDEDVIAAMTRPR